MTLKLSPNQAATIKDAVRDVESATDAVKAATDTGALKAALNRLWYATQHAADTATRLEREANEARRHQLMEQAQ